MEKDSPSKPSVAELAGRLKGHILPMPTPDDELLFIRRKPPCCLKLQTHKDNNEESEKAIVSPNPFKIKARNSPIIERLQANLALSPTSLLPSPKAPDMKHPPTSSLSPTSPCSPLSPHPRPAHQSSEEEEPVGFEDPPDGTPLPSINKTRARLSFKRRPPTRQHRRSAGEEDSLSPSELDRPIENGDKEHVFKSPAEEEEEEEEEEEDEREATGSVKEAEDKDTVCEKAEGTAAKADSDQEQQGRGAVSSEAEEDEEERRASETRQTEANDTGTKEEEEEEGEQRDEL